MTCARRLFALLGALVGAYGIVVRPRLLRWGATDEELRPRYPGADLIPGGQRGATMAVTIDAPPSLVWPWLVQMGCDRAGWYSWDRLDNGGVASAQEIRPEWQHIAVGDHLASSPSGHVWFEVAVVEPERFLALRAPLDLRGRPFDVSGPRPRFFSDSLWGFLLEELPGGRTRLVVSGYASSNPRPLTAIGDFVFWEPAHWIMQALQFANLKQRAERSPGSAARPPRPSPRRSARQQPPEPRAACWQTSHYRSWKVLHERGKLTSAALTFRIAHAAIASAFLLAIAYVWWFALTGRRTRLLPVAVTALTGEGVFVVANGGDCPLGGLQEGVGDPVPLFELVLSPAMARRAVPVLGAVTAAGVAVLASRSHDSGALFDGGAHESLRATRLYRQDARGPQRELGQGSAAPSSQPFSASWASACKTRQPRSHWPSRGVTDATQQPAQTKKSDMLYRTCWIDSDAKKKENREALERSHPAILPLMPDG